MRVERGVGRSVESVERTQWIESGIVFCFECSEIRISNSKVFSCISSFLGEGICNCNLWGRNGWEKLRDPASGGARIP